MSKRTPKPTVKPLIIKLCILVAVLVFIVVSFFFLLKTEPIVYDKTLIQLSPKNGIVESGETFTVTVLGDTSADYNTAIVQLDFDDSMVFDSYVCNVEADNLIVDAPALDNKNSMIVLSCTTLHQAESLFDVVLNSGDLSFEKKPITASIEYLNNGQTVKTVETAFVVKNCKDWEEFKEIFKSEFPGATWDTLYVTVLSTLISFIIGLPLGVLLVAGEKRGVLPIPKPILSILNIIINLLRSVPFLILMILVFPLTRAIIGKAYGTGAMIIPLVIAAFPFVARLVETSLREVNPNVIEAAASMGATPFQIITKVMIPESVPSLISNLTIALTTILGYSAMSGAIGGGGLGMIAINYGYYRYQTLIMIAAVIVLIIMVQIFQCVGTWLTVKCDKRLKG